MNAVLSFGVGLFLGVTLTLIGAGLRVRRIEAAAYERGVLHGKIDVLRARTPKTTRFQYETRPVKRIEA